MRATISGAGGSAVLLAARALAGEPELTGEFSAVCDRESVSASGIGAIRRRTQIAEPLNAARDGCDSVTTSLRDAAALAASMTARPRHRLLPCASGLVLMWSPTAEGLAVNRGYAANGPCQASPDGGGRAA
jgi:hypothetical protein